MSEVDISRARVIEFDTLYKDGTVSLLVSRRQSSNAFKPLGVNGEPPTEDWGIWRAHDIVSSGTNIRILAEFPATLADLIPDGCTEFRFKTPSGILRVALQHPTGSWEVTGMHHEWRVGSINHDSLAQLESFHEVRLESVVPLVPHPDYVEERR